MNGDSKSCWCHSAVWDKELVEIKNRGGLTFPSPSAIKICQLCERKFRTRVTVGSHSSHKKTVYCDKQKLVHAVFVSCPNIFPDLFPHMTDTDPVTNHIFMLVKAVSETYLDLRYHYAGKQHTHGLQSMKSCKSRQMHNKLILFSGL